MLLLALFLNHNHSLHNRHVHNYNYLFHKNYRTTTWTSIIQFLHTITLKHKTHLTFILHTHNYYPKMILFFMSNKPPLTNKIIIHPPLGHLHNNHKYKHQTEMNISPLTKIPLYDFMRKAWMILVRMRINSSLITSITKAMMRELADQRHLRHLCCNITNLGVQSTWTLTTYHITLIDTISFSNNIKYTHHPVHSRLAWPSMKKHNAFEQSKNTTSKIILIAEQFILTRES